MRALHGSIPSAPSATPSRHPVIEGHEETGTLTQWYRRAIEKVRQAIAARIRQALPGETGEIALALITGERGGITAATNDAFKNSGLFHILSISGLHMVIAAGAVFYSVRLILAAIPLIALTLPIKKIAAVAGILSAIAYLAISGGQFATVRSALMILIIFGAVLLDRPALALRNVAFAAFLILLVYPESLLDAGFQMSFAAVTALIASHETLTRLIGRQSRPNPVMKVVQFFGEIIASTLIASVAVAPFAAYNFHQSQQYAVLGNMIAIPICNVIVMPAALLAMVLMPFGLEGLGLKPMGWGIEGMVWCANKVGALPGAVGHIPEIPATRLRADARWRHLACALADADKAIGRGVRVSRCACCALDAAARYPDRPEGLDRRARRFWKAFRAAGERLQIRSRSLARIRRRWPHRARGAKGRSVHVRRGRMHRPCQRRDRRRREPSSSRHRRLPERRRARASTIRNRRSARSRKP